MKRSRLLFVIAAASLCAALILLSQIWRGEQRPSSIIAEQGLGAYAYNVPSSDPSNAGFDENAYLLKPFQHAGKRNAHQRTSRRSDEADVQDDAEESGAGDINQDSDEVAEQSDIVRSSPSVLSSSQILSTARQSGARSSSSMMIFRGASHPAHRRQAVLARGQGEHVISRKHSDHDDHHDGRIARQKRLRAEIQRFRQHLQREFHMHRSSSGSRVQSRAEDRPHHEQAPRRQHVWEQHSMKGWPMPGDSLRRRVHHVEDQWRAEGWRAPKSSRNDEELKDHGDDSDSANDSQENQWNQFTSTMFHHTHHSLHGQGSRKKSQAEERIRERYSRERRDAERARKDPIGGEDQFDSFADSLGLARITGKPVDSHSRSINKFGFSGKSARADSLIDAMLGTNDSLQKARHHTSGARRGRRIEEEESKESQTRAKSLVDSIIDSRYREKRRHEAKLKPAQ